MDIAMRVLMELGYFTWACTKSLVTSTRDPRNNQWNCLCIWAVHVGKMYDSDVRPKYKPRQRKPKIESEPEYYHPEHDGQNATVIPPENQLPSGEEEEQLTQEEVNKIVEETILAFLPSMISRKAKDLNISPKQDWTVWQHIGYLSGSDFPNAHPNFQVCFKPGEYVAKHKFIDPQGNGKIHWMFSQDLTLQGKYGSNVVVNDEEYAHYSIFYYEDTGLETGQGEHFTPVPEVRVYFRQIPIGQGVKGRTRDEKITNSWNDIIRPYITLQKEVTKYLL